MEEAKLKALGKTTEYTYEGASAELLEKFPNPFWQITGDEGAELNPEKKIRNPNGVGGSIHIEVPEFTSLCPKTGQPDFATIIIDYIPREWCVESKSLKLYMMSFRNVGEFHESCVVKIANDLIALMQPYKIQVTGRFTPRGGIPFWPTATWMHKDVAQPQAPQRSVIAPHGIVVPN